MIGIFVLSVYSGYCQFATNALKIICEFANGEMLIKFCFPGYFHGVTHAYVAETCLYKVAIFGLF